MANTTIPNLPAAITLDGTEQVEVVQPPGSTSGVSKRTTTQAIANLAADASGILPRTLTQSALLLGNGTGAIQAVTNVTAGYVLTANGPTSAPTFQGAGGLSNQPPLSVLGVGGTATATPSGIVGTQDKVLRVAADGSSVAFGSINLATAAAVSGILAVVNGGVGAATLAPFSVLLGNGTGVVASVGPGSAGQVLVGVGAASNPIFATVVGDVGFSESGTATINAGAVTYSKFQIVPALSVVANASSATTNVDAVSGAANQSLKINAGGTGMSFGLIDLTTGTNVTGILSVGMGGVGTTTLGANAVLLGNGTAGVTSVTNVTTGYILTSNGPGSAPTFQGAGGLSNQTGLSILGVTGTAAATPAAIIGTTDQVVRVDANGTALTFGAVNLATSAAVTGVLPVVNGGIGVGTLTTNGVLLGAGTSAITALANVTSGYVLTANGTSSAPTWQGSGGLASQPGLSVVGVTGVSTTTPTAIIGTTNQVLIVQPNGTALVFGQVNLAATAAVTGVLVVGNGGVGTSSLTAHGVLVGAGTSTVKITVPGTAGQLLIGQSAVTDPAFVTVGADLTISEAGTATIANNAVTYAKIQSVSALSVVANSSSATTNVNAVSGAANQVLRVNPGGTSLGFGQINLSSTSAITGSIASAYFTGILDVPFGGTGTSSLASNRVLLGNNTGLAFIANATSGYVLTANGTSSAPTFSPSTSLSSVSGPSALGVSGTASAIPGAITGTQDQILRVGSDGTTLAFGQLNIGTSAAVTGILTVPFGGTGTSNLTAFGVMVGNGTSTVGVTAAGSAGQLLIGQTGTSNPAFATIVGDLILTAVGTATIAANAVTYSKFQTVAALSVVGNTSSAVGNAAAITGAANQVLVVNAAGTALTFGQVSLATATNVTGILPVGNGGSGTSALTANGLVVGNGTSAVTIITAGSAGQILVGQTTTSNPSFQTVSGDITLSSVGTATIANNAVTYAKFQTVTGLSVVGNGSTTTTNAAAVTGVTDQVLVINAAGTGMVFGAVNLAKNGTAITGSLTSANIATSAFMMLATTGQAYSGGVTLSFLNLGTAAATTTTLTAGNPPIQLLVINGTAAIVAPSNDCEIDLLLKNSTSASTLTFSGYTGLASVGDAYTTTNGSAYIFMSRTINAISTYSLKVAK